MNILTYIPMPMPIVMHGGGGSVVASHYTGVCLLAAVFFGVLMLLSACCGVACAVWGKDDDVPMKAVVTFLFLAMLFVAASLICGIFGV
jgi:hypothetical protein